MSFNIAKIGTLAICLTMGFSVSEAGAGEDVSAGSILYKNVTVKHIDCSERSDNAYGDSLIFADSKGISHSVNIGSEPEAKCRVLKAAIGKQSIDVGVALYDDNDYSDDKMGDFSLREGLDGVNVGNKVLVRGFSTKPLSKVMCGQQSDGWNVCVMKNRVGLFIQHEAAPQGNGAWANGLSSILKADQTTENGKVTLKVFTGGSEDEQVILPAGGSSGYLLVQTVDRASGKITATKKAVISRP